MGSCRRNPTKFYVRCQNLTETISNLKNVKLIELIKPTHSLSMWIDFNFMKNIAKIERNQINVLI